MKRYKTKSDFLAGSNYKEVRKKVSKLFKDIESKTKRRPYIRSVYFEKEKIFFDYFFEHLKQKNERDKIRRLKVFACAMELVVKTKLKPVSIVNPNKTNEVLHKFFGETKSGSLFYVHIKEDKEKKKYVMSCFPES